MRKDRYVACRAAPIEEKAQHVLPVHLHELGGHEIVSYDDRGLRDSYLGYHA